MSVVRSFTTRNTFRVNLRKMTVNSTRKGAKHKNARVRDRFSASIAASTPATTKMFFAMDTRTLVNIWEMALVSLATRVTSLPTGILLSWSWDRLSMWVNRSCRRAERIFCPVFCRMMYWT